mgnify:CR=1 FL=1
MEAATVDHEAEEGFALLRDAVITSIEEDRRDHGLCPECGSPVHEGCFLLEGTLITMKEFLDHAAILIAQTVEAREL